MRMTSLSAFLALSGLLVTAAGMPSAQTQEPQAPQLGLAKSLSCIFPLAVSATWDKDTGEPSVAIKKTAVLSFKFDEIDPTESSARFVGPTAAPEHIVAQLSGPNLYLMDLRASGSLSITTVFGQYSHDLKMKAVYTRADYLPISLPGFVSQPEVSQRYGECEVGP